MNLHRLDLVSLSLFQQVARAGSISKGAEQAGIAIAAASRRLTELESALGAPILDRHSRGISLTPAGLALIRHAERILDNVRQMDSELSDYARGVLGVVRLWTNTAALSQGLPRQLAAFESSHSIRVELQEHDSTEVVLGLIEDRADLGVLAEGTQLLGLEACDYSEDRLMLAAPPGHPLASRRRSKFHDVAAFDLVTLPQEASLTKRLVLHATEIGIALRLRYQVQSYEAMWHMVGAGLGVGILPGAAARTFSAATGVRLAALSDPWAKRKLLVASRDFNALTRSSRSLLDHLRGDGGVNRAITAKPRS